MFFQIAAVPLPTSTTAVDSPEDTILQTGRLFVRNLPFTSTDEEVSAHFAAHGEVAQVSRIICFGSANEIVLWSFFVMINLIGTSEPRTIVLVMC